VNLMLANHFLAGAVLTMALPVGLVLAVGIYWGLLLRKRAAGARSGKTQ
jgi:hypothetical protein